MSPQPQVVSKRVWIVLAVLIPLYILETCLEYGRGQMPLEGVPISIVMGIILFIPLTILLIALEQAFIHRVVDERIQKLVYWTPRIGMVLFALFIGLFALDVFNDGYTAQQTMLALIIHLAPTLVFLMAIVIAWRWEWVGALVLIGWAAWYAVALTGFSLSVYIQLSGLPLVLGVLFLLNWRQRTRTPALL